MTLVKVNPMTPAEARQRHGPADLPIETPKTGIQTDEHGRVLWLKQADLDSMAAFSGLACHNWDTFQKTEVFHRIRQQVLSDSEDLCFKCRMPKATHVRPVCISAALDAIPDWQTCAYFAVCGNCIHELDQGIKAIQQMTRAGFCCATTKSGRSHRQCRVPADRCRSGKWYCHLHDPQGRNQAFLRRKYSRR